MLEFDEADGFLPVRVRPAGGGEPVEVMLDIYEVNNFYAQLCDAHEEADARGRALVAWLRDEKGLPVYAAQASVIVELACNAAAEFKKKHDGLFSSPTPDSPASSEPPSAG